ncbi:hypothetical protein B1207_06940 [Legionella quinlivanii]|uniref:Uncharacterized protein n=1 Tax=Legionella quinlivanii TaxID=45073 RepID=A0A364LKL9_9GAMM|nr:hypothetical protein [Legionella quinlivanii]RAP37148.1 hypothetical protein B1207_06940 [Legionella quinlivanii]
MFLGSKERKELIIKEFISLLEKNNGLCLLHNHNDLAFWENLISILPSLTSVKHIYFEFTDGKGVKDKVPVSKNSPVLEAVKNFCLSPEVQTDEDSEKELQTYMLGRLLDCISLTDMVMFFVDDPERDKKTNAQRNDYMFECIEHLKAGLNDNENYLLITGAAHFELADRLQAPILMVGSSFYNENVTNRDYIAVKHKESVASNTMQSVEFIADTIITTAISPYQMTESKRDFFIYPGDWNLNKDTLSKIENIQKMTGLGISLELGRPTKRDKQTGSIYYADKSPSIRLIIAKNDLSDEAFKNIMRYLKGKSKSSEYFSFWDTKDNASVTSLKSNKNQLTLTFYTNKSFINAIDTLDRSLSSVNPSLTLRKP